MLADAGGPADHRHAAFAVTAAKLLGSERLPVFSPGTDLILPVSANGDLRRELGIPEPEAAAAADATDADLQIHLAAMDYGCLDSEVHVPQILASAAFLAGSPGVAFRGSETAERAERGDEEEREGEERERGSSHESWSGHQQPLRKPPRFGCRFRPEVRTGRSRRSGCVVGWGVCARGGEEAIACRCW